MLNPNAHLCIGGNARRIRRYPTALCSLCTGQQSVDIFMEEDAINKYNQSMKELDEARDKYSREIAKFHSKGT